MVRIIISLFNFCYFIYYVVGEGYENEDKLYLISPDQHEATPRLEDFFWTGSGDGPPPPPEAHAPIAPSKPVVRTTTVLATVYLDSYPPEVVTDKTTGECIKNCGDGEPGVPDSLEPEIHEDRRYWLLTVIQGSTPDSLQLKLARLYQKAFLRQQEKHLGIIKSLDAPTSRKKHDVHSFIINRDNNFKSSLNTTTPLRYLDIYPSMTIKEPVAATKVFNSSQEMPNISVESAQIYPLKLNESDVQVKAPKLEDIESWVLATPTVIIEKRDVTDELGAIRDFKEDLIDISLEDANNETTLFKREIIKPEQQPPVQVHIQNITESPDTGSVQIVYVVLVGGRAVPAAVAARDMRLVRDAEVATELGAAVTTKAEPYLKAAEDLEGESTSATGVHGTELWALAIGGSIAVLLVMALIVLLCLAHRKKNMKSAASLRAYHREIERNQLKQVYEEKDGKLVSVVSPSRTRPCSTLLPVFRPVSSTSSTSSSGISEVAAVLRRKQKKPHALRMPHKKRVGTTDSLLEAAGLDSSDSGQQSVPRTPTSYLSMPSVNSFPRGNLVEPLSKILEPVSVRHLDIDSPIVSPRRKTGASVPRRQMASQLVRLGSLDKDPGVVGPLVWDLHCQRIKDASKPSSPAKSGKAVPSRMRQRFNELVDDAFTLFGSTGSSPDSHDTYTVGIGKSRVGKRDEQKVTQARNDNVRLPGSPYTAMDTIRRRSAGPMKAGSVAEESADVRPRTSFSKPAAERRAPPPARAWGTTPPHSLSLGSRMPSAPNVNPAIILAEGRLQPDDPAIPVISAIKDEIQRMRENAKPNM